MLSKEQESNPKLHLNNNDQTLMDYIDSVCSDMFSPWVPKLLMDVFILSEHHENYNIIEHVNQDCLHRIYFDPRKYHVTNKFEGEGYDLLCKDLATSAIK